MPWARPSTPSDHRTCARWHAAALLGNVGRPGGGVNALRGESNVQGSTDQGLLAHLLTAYMPVATSADPT